MTKPRSRFLTIGPLRALCTGWQARLGLQGFVVDLQLVRASVFNDHSTLGDCDAMRTKRKARIRLLVAEDYDDPDARCDDHETCLVHELLHLVMPIRLFAVKVDDDDLRYQLYEEAIDQLARTLVTLKRATG